MSDEIDFLETKDMSLSEWLSLVEASPPGIAFNNYSFPSDSIHDEFLASVHLRSEEEIKRLLSGFLMESCSLISDERRIEFLSHLQENEREQFTKAMSFQSNIRLMRYHHKVSLSPPWEGVTWALDLLPHFPHQAIEAISAYLLAHYGILPDGRIDGFEDALSIIRARYIGTPHDMSGRIAALRSISPRGFEHVVERLYNRLGYSTMITPVSRDGGRDVIATNSRAGRLEHVRVECKQYSNPIGVSILRSLLGVVSDEKVNKGVLVTTSRFTRDAQLFGRRNPRVELISGPQLVALLNEHLGERWPIQLDGTIAESRRRLEKQIDA